MMIDVGRLKERDKEREREKERLRVHQVDGGPELMGGVARDTRGGKNASGGNNNSLNNAMGRDFDKEDEDDEEIRRNCINGIKIMIEIIEKNNSEIEKQRKEKTSQVQSLTPGVIHGVFETGSKSAPLSSSSFEEEEHTQSLSQPLSSPPISTTSIPTSPSSPSSPSATTASTNTTSGGSIKKYTSLIGGFFYRDKHVSAPVGKAQV
jgi:hypothetical protein